MSRPRILDLFCGAGGATRGYQNAGFYVVGIDRCPMPNYCGDEFIQADALDPPVLWNEFEAVHASPPCQASSRLRRGRWPEREHPELIAPVRKLLRASGLPYVMENVEGAALHEPLVLCGSMFGLGVRRHRLFESNVALIAPSGCRHVEQGPVISVQGHTGGRSTRDGTTGRGTVADWRRAMGIDWMTAAELAQAIPPAYAEHVGGYLTQAVRSRAPATS